MLFTDIIPAHKPSLLIRVCFLCFPLRGIIREFRRASVAHAGLCRAAAAAVGEGKHKHRKVSDDCRCLRQEGGERGREAGHGDGRRDGGVEVCLGGRSLLHLQQDGFREQ